MIGIAILTAITVSSLASNAYFSACANQRKIAHKEKYVWLARLQSEQVDITSILLIVSVAFIIIYTPILLPNLIAFTLEFITGYIRLVQLVGSTTPQRVVKFNSSRFLHCSLVRYNNNYYNGLQ